MMDTESLYKLFLSCPAVETDSRKAGPGKIFFALKGEKFNGNLFAKQAVEAGCPYAVVDEDIDTGDPRLIRVKDGLEALQQLAKYHRQQLSIPVIAITGSNGKTTTKELIHAVLSSHFITYTTEGNLNNHIGVPLTLLKVRSDAQMAIVEMGANHQKEIESYCTYALPTHGLITNCGKAHLEGFGGVEGVRKGKGELYDFIRLNKGTLFVNADYDYLKEMSKGVNDVIYYGSREGIVQGVPSSADGLLCAEIRRGMEPCVIRTHLVGEYNMPNVLAAVCIGKYFSVPEEKIISALESYMPSNSRSQLMKKGSNTIIMDAYNANPSSMQAAIENFSSLEADNKVVMLGGMMELGEESVAEHSRIMDLLKKGNWKEVVLVGKDYTDIPAGYHHFNNSEEAGEWFNNQHFENITLLLKGSRGMAMEKVIRD